MILRLRLPDMASLRKKTIGFSFGSHNNKWSVYTQSSSRNKSNFDPRSSSLSLASLHSTCTRENSLERATQSCPTSPTKVPLPLDSPLLSKVRLRCSVSTNVLENEACQEMLQGPLDPTIQRVRSFKRELRRARSFRAARERVDVRHCHPPEQRVDTAQSSLCPSGTQVSTD